MMKANDYEVEVRIPPPVDRSEAGRLRRQRQRVRRGPQQSGSSLKAEK